MRKSLFEIINFNTEKKDFSFVFDQTIFKMYHATLSMWIYLKSRQQSL